MLCLCSCACRDIPGRVARYDSASSDEEYGGVGDGTMACGSGYVVRDGVNGLSNGVGGGAIVGDALGKERAAERGRTGLLLTGAMLSRCDDGNNDEQTIPSCSGSHHPVAMVMGGRWCLGDDVETIRGRTTSTVSRDNGGIVVRRRCGQRTRRIDR